MSEQPKPLPRVLDQHLRRLAYRFSPDDKSYDKAVELLTLLVFEALDYHKTSVQETMAAVLARGARQAADELAAGKTDR